MQRQSDALHPVVRRFIEEAGHATQAFGMGRVLGQIYAFLYFSPKPRNLQDMQDALGISKGSASMGVRQLEQWEAVRKVWVKGDRKDYYEASDWFGRILKRAAAEAMAKRTAAFASLVEDARSELNEDEGDGELRFIRERIDRIDGFRERAQTIWNSSLVQRLLK